MASSVFEDRTATVGHTRLVNKRMLLPQQKAVAPGTEPVGQETANLADMDLGMELTHRHFGMAKEHPVALRHGKEQLDRYHKDEDKLVDEYRDLFAKAKGGMATPQDILRVRQIKTALQQINQSRLQEAQGVAGALGSGAGGDQMMQKHRVDKAEDDKSVFQVLEDDLEDDGKTYPKGQWREYGEDEFDDDKVIPTNDGHADQRDRSESLYGTVKKDPRLHVAFPSDVQDAPVHKAGAMMGHTPVPYNQGPVVSQAMDEFEANKQAALKTGAVGPKLDEHHVDSDPTNEHHKKDYQKPYRSQPGYGAERDESPWEEDPQYGADREESIQDVGPRYHAEAEAEAARQRIEREQTARAQPSIKSLGIVTDDGRRETWLGAPRALE